MARFSSIVRFLVAAERYRLFPKFCWRSRESGCQRASVGRGLGASGPGTPMPRPDESCLAEAGRGDREEFGERGNESNPKIPVLGMAGFPGHQEGREDTEKKAIEKWTEGRARGRRSEPAIANGNCGPPVGLDGAAARMHVAVEGRASNFPLDPALRPPTPTRANAARFGDPGSAACRARIVPCLRHWIG